MKRLGLLAVAALLLACKFEPIESFEFDEPPSPGLPHHVVPLSVDAEHSDSDTAQWNTSLNKHLGFLLGPDLEGRRPGTTGAGLTVGFVISEFEHAGLSPNGPDMGWTQAVGIRVVDTISASIEVRYGAEEGTPARPPLRIDDGLWLRHRGAAGSRNAIGRLVESAASAPAENPTDNAAPTIDQRFLVAPAPAPEAPDAPVADHEAEYHQVFDDAWRDGMTIALLPLDRADASALAAAERWQQPDVQSLLPGRDPPAALELQGFVEAQSHRALRQAAAIPGTIAEVDYLATERWFKDDNVIGRIAGRRRPEQAVVVVAPWDAGGLGAEVEGGGGAAEAGGLAALLAVAEASGRWQAAGRRPDRSIVFVAEAAASLGHRGIVRFVEASGIRPENIVAVVNLERLGGAGSELVVVDGERSDLGHEIHQLVPSAILSTPSPAGPAYGHTPFLDVEIPAITVTRPAIGTEQDPEPQLSTAALRTDARTVFRLVWALANQAEAPRLSEEPPPDEPSATAAPSADPTTEGDEPTTPPP